MSDTATATFMTEPTPGTQEPPERLVPTDPPERLSPADPPERLSPAEEPAPTVPPTPSEHANAALR